MITERERQAVECIGKGLNLDQSADKLCISRSGVEKLLQRAKKRLNAKNLANAVYIAAKSGLIVWVCAMTFETGEKRRNVRPARRNQYEFIIIPKLI